jgi:hypothetical protein
MSLRGRRIDGQIAEVPSTGRNIALEGQASALTRRFVLFLVLKSGRVGVMEMWGVLEYCTRSECTPRPRVGDAESAAQYRIVLHLAEPLLPITGDPSGSALATN